MTSAELKQARLDARLTQSKAAATVGVALRTWQHWEMGDRKMPESAWQLFLILTDNQERS